MKKLLPVLTAIACTLSASALDEFPSRFDLLTAQQIEVEDPDDPEIDVEEDPMWERIGWADVVDAWILPSYNIGDERINPFDFAFSCVLQRNVENRKLFRLWQPYQSEGFILSFMNQSAYQGQVVFDITDPDHVIVYAGYPAGFKNSRGEFYVFGMLGWHINSYGDTYDPEKHLDGIISSMEENGQAFDTYKDGLVTIAKSIFDFDIKCENRYHWTDNPYETTLIFLPPEVEGVNAITAEDAAAPVEYYNLQGVRVENPAAGELVIKKQGTHVMKILVR